MSSVIPPGLSQCATCGVMFEGNRGCLMCYPAAAAPPAGRGFVEDFTVLGCCPHGVDLDREFCPKGCRV